MRYVSACHEVSFGPGAVVAVPSVLMYGVEGHSTGLYGPRCPVDSKEGQYGEVHSPVDSLPANVVGLFEGGTLGDINRYHAFQRPRPVVSSSLQDSPAWAPPYRISVGVHVYASRFAASHARISVPFGRDERRDSATAENLMYWPNMTQQICFLKYFLF